MIRGDDLKDMVCIHRKHFDNIGLPKEGSIVSIYYRYDNDLNQISIDDYSIQFVVDGKPGINVADKQSIVVDEVYRYLFKTTYVELLKHVIAKIK